MATKKKKVEDYLSLEMEGKVWIVSQEKGKVTRTEVEPKVVLGILVNALTRAIVHFADKAVKQPKKKK